MEPVVLSKPGKVRLELLPPLALYVHIPWCVRKCPYCDFNSHERSGELPEREYVERLIADLEDCLASVWGRRVCSVFIGGGTPSLFSPGSIETLLSGVRARLPLEPGAEITLEANPGTVEAARLSVPHGSAYQLAIEPNTVFWSKPPQLPQHDESADMQLAAEEALGAAGYGHYETSAFARPGHRCRHNLNYWEFGDYVGIGAGAHGKLSLPGRITRHSRIKQPREYLLSKDSLIEDREVPANEIPFEFMLNALRLVEGFPTTLFAERTGLALATVEAKLAKAENQGLIERDWKRIRPSARGRLFLNELLQIFLEGAPARSSAA